jgi:hypothetical protein
MTSHVGCAVGRAGEQPGSSRCCWNVLFLTTVWRRSILGAGAALTPGPIVAAVTAPVVAQR